MKIVLRIIKPLAIILLAVLIFLLAAPRVMQDKVADIVINTLNQKISTKVHTAGFRLSFLSRFPKASLELSNVLVTSSTGFNRSAFRGMNTDTLFFARNVSIEFRITDIIFGNYTVERIGARAGRLNILTDSAGMVNYNISGEKKKEGSEDLAIDLERIHLSDIRAYYNNIATRVIISGSITKGTLKSRFRGENIILNAVSEASIDSFRTHDLLIAERIPASINISLVKTRDGISFDKGNLKVENSNFGLNGFISSANVYDLRLTGKDIDIARIIKYLPGKYIDEISDYDPDGILKIDGTIKGLMTKTRNPHTQFNFRLEKGRIGYGKSRLKLTGLTFEGSYSNGSGNRPETAELKVNDIRFRLGSSDYSASLSFSGLTDPNAVISLRGRAYPGEIKEFFNLQSISAAGGSIDLDMKLNGKISLKRKPSSNDYLNLHEEGSMEFHDFSVSFNDRNFATDKVNGSLLFSRSVIAKGLILRYKGQTIRIDGEFRNLFQWLGKRPVQLEAKADVAFDRLMPETFSRKPAGSSKTSEMAFRLPDDMILDMTFRIDSLRYNAFSSSDISGSLNYKPKLMTFKSFYMKSLKGIISGNGFIFQNADGSILSKGIFNVTDADVNLAFKTFRNFGQNFLKAENIAGSLSGSFTILLPMDSTLKTQIKSLTAEGKFMLADGALVNFDPVKELSSYIELSELENIHFEKMENNFFIRNNYLYIPTMEVNSSAVDLSVNGKHSFDNDYEYHVKVLLSEILSKKRRRNKKTVTEFGAIQDDGLGRTSMLLKIVNKGEDVKVSYDMKAAANEVKSNLQTEKKNLKNILNEEYGWFEKDTTVKDQPAEKKPKVKVIWEDK